MRRYAICTLAGLAALGLVPAHAVEGVGFRYGGETVIGEALPGELEQQLFEIELHANEQRKRAIDNFIIGRYLRELSEAEGISMGEAQQKVLAVEPPSEEALQAHYDANRDRFPLGFPVSREDVVAEVQRELILQKVDELLATLEAEKGYEAILVPAEAPVFEFTLEGYPSKGGADAKVTVVEFADYRCPHCKNAVAAVDRMVERFGDEVRVVFRDFPLDPSGISRSVAQGAVCADQQGRFWDYHALAFERQESLEADSPAVLADELGLDGEAFGACLESGDAEARVAASYEEAIEAGVAATPAFFVNGRQLHLHGDVEQVLTEAVEEALAE